LAFFGRKQVSVARRILLAVLLSQLISIALILGWYFYVLRSELDSLRRHGAEEAVLQSIAATEDYLKPAEQAVAEGQLLLSQHVIGPDNPDPLERFFFEQLRVRPLLDGLYIGNPAGEFFQVMRSNEKVNDGTRTKVIQNGPLGREVALTWRGPDYAIVKSERDPADTYDPRARVWYRIAIEQRGRAWTEPYIFFTSHKPGITLASAITGKDDAIKAVLGVDIEISQILRFLTRYSLLEQKSIYISTTEGKVIAHSNESVVLPGSTAGDGSLRFRVISELPGVEGTLAESVLKRLAEPAGTRSSIVWEAKADGQDYFVAVGQMSNIAWPWQVGTKNWTVTTWIPKHRHTDRRDGPRRLVGFPYRLRNEPGRQRADAPTAWECAAGSQSKCRAHGRRELRLEGNRRNKRNPQRACHTATR
jgi:hypothetical protein